MMFDDNDDVLEMWGGLHEQVNVPFMQEEMEVLDACEIPYGYETRIAVEEQE